MQPGDEPLVELDQVEPVVGAQPVDQYGRDRAGAGPDFKNPARPCGAARSGLRRGLRPGLRSESAAAKRVRARARARPLGSTAPVV